MDNRNMHTLIDTMAISVGSIFFKKYFRDGIDQTTQKLITSYLRKLERLEEPRSKGNALSSNLKGFWRYRIGDYRVICEIDDGDIIIVVVDIGHRKNIYIYK